MKLFVFDTETALTAPGRQAPPMACLTWATPGAAGIDNPHAGLRRVRDALLDSDTYIVGANIAYDLGVISQADPSLMPSIFAALDADRIGCTQTLSQLHYIAGRQNAPRHGLAYVAKKWLDLDVEGKQGGPDSWRLHYGRLIGMGVDSWPTAARDYAIMDAIITRDVWLAQSEQMVPDLHPQVRAAWALQVMRAWGFRVDPEAVIALDQRIRPPVERLTEELTAAGIYRPDGTQDKKRLQALVEEAYRGNPPCTDKGNIKTDEETLRESGHPDLLKLANVAKDQKELSSFLPMLLESARTGLPVCPSWNVLVRSGRTSCRKPNAQQLPRRSGVRECIVPRAGNLFFGADYSIAELCSLAQVLYNETGPNSMQRALNAGQDLHVLTASRILGIGYDEAWARYLVKDSEVKAMRALAKACNFGYPGGLGARTFVDYAADYGVDISEERSHELRRHWLAAYPEMRGYFDRVSNATSAGLATFVQPYSGRLRAMVGYTDGCNTKFQGLTADGAKRALYEVTRRQLIDRRSNLYGTRLNVFVHDELVGEGPVEQAPEAGDEMAKIMVEEMSVVAPDVRHHADPFLMERWTKGAEMKRDQRGRLCL